MTRERKQIEIPWRELDAWIAEIVFEDERGYFFESYIS